MKIKNLPDLRESVVWEIFNFESLEYGEAVQQDLNTSK